METSNIFLLFMLTYVALAGLACLYNWYWQSRPVPSISRLEQAYAIRNWTAKIVWVVLLIVFVVIMFNDTTVCIIKPKRGRFYDIAGEQVSAFIRYKDLPLHLNETVISNESNITAGMFDVTYDENGKIVRVGEPVYIAPGAVYPIKFTKIEVKFGEPKTRLNFSYQKNKKSRPKTIYYINNVTNTSTYQRQAKYGIGEDNVFDYQKILKDIQERRQKFTPAQPLP